jgi:hypothetical protein
MHPSDLHQALARATGESIGTLRQRGFSLVVPDSPELELAWPEVEPRVVDWDRLQADRRLAVPV